MSGTGFLKEKPHGPTEVASDGQKNKEKILELARAEAARK